MPLRQIIYQNFARIDDAEKVYVKKACFARRHNCLYLDTNVELNRFGRDRAPAGKGDCMSREIATKLGCAGVAEYLLTWWP